jgi:hypothetical protein
MFVYTDGPIRRPMSFLLISLHKLGNSFFEFAQSPRMYHVSLTVLRVFNVVRAT